MNALKRYGVARIISKRGYCSRSEAERLVRAGSVTLEGRRVADPETPAAQDSHISVNGKEVTAQAFRYFILNKPRGIITSASDEKGRRTVIDLIQPLNLPHIAPVGRLDAASEGLLLLTNDTAFADSVLAPETHREKEYHVQTNKIPAEEDLRKCEAGFTVPARIYGKPPEYMQMRSAEILRANGKTAWLKIILDEGKNREIRRMLEALGYEVQRLIRVRIGNISLGDLKPGEIREIPKP